MLKLYYLYPIILKRKYSSPTHIFEYNICIDIFEYNNLIYNIPYFNIENNDYIKLYFIENITTFKDFMLKILNIKKYSNFNNKYESNEDESNNESNEYETNIIVLYNIDTNAIVILLVDEILEYNDRLNKKIDNLEMTFKNLIITETELIQNKIVILDNNIKRKVYKHSNYLINKIKKTQNKKLYRHIMKKINKQNYKLYTNKLIKKYNIISCIYKYFIIISL
jgi:hypothetical protein